jgi:hypothetical protein
MTVDDQIQLLVFATGTVVGGDAHRTALEGRFSSLTIDADADGRIWDYSNAYEDTIQVSDGTFLVTAAMMSLAAHALPGAVVAYLRVGPADETSAIYHEAGSAGEVSGMDPGRIGTATVPIYPGHGWMERATVRALEFEPGVEPPPIADWPVNAALRALGVEPGESPDEARALGLRLPRHP